MITLALGDDHPVFVCLNGHTAIPHRQTTGVPLERAWQLTAREKFCLVSVEYILVNALWHVQPMSNHELLHLTVRTISATASKHRR